MPKVADVAENFPKLPPPMNYLSKIRTIHLRYLVLLSSLMAVTQAPAALVNIQINGHGGYQDQSDPKPPDFHGAGAVGFEGSVWNHVLADCYKQELALLLPEKIFADDGKTATRLTLSFSGFESSDYYPQTQGALVSNDLLNSYVVYRAGASVTITGLIPKAPYDVYLFGSNSRGGYGGAFTVNGDSIQSTEGGNTGAIFSEGVDFAAFRGVAADSSGRLIVTANPNGKDIGVLNGIQVSGTFPEPTERALLPDITRFVNAKLGGELDERGVFTSEPPISFLYDGNPSAKLLEGWNTKRESRKLDKDRVEHVATFTDPQTGLEVRCVGIEYKDFPIVEWTPYLKNTGKTDTPIIEKFLGIDTSFLRSAKSEFILNYQRGSLMLASDYEPLQAKLAPREVKQIATSGGRPCNDYLPYFNIEWSGGGVIIAVGWPGQWSATFARDAGNALNVRAGQELTHFRLHPGEEVRGPLIAVVFYKGDRIEGQNIWRRWMVAHNIPRNNGQLPANSFAACTSHEFHEMLNATEENQKHFIDRYFEEGFKPDYWWMDAGWYRQNGTWQNTGTWEADKIRFPNGLKPISNHIAALGGKSILWFEPERVTASTWLYDNHPEWLLKQASYAPPNLAYQAPWRLLDLGNQDARKWLVKQVDTLLNDEGISFYRQDFNMDPLYFWRGNDAEDRQGITEIGHVTGYLAFWDELLRLNPNRRIDSCASGGRRNDLETMRRAVPLLRSDYVFEPAGQQAHTYALSYWLPFQGTPFIDRNSIINSPLIKPAWIRAIDESRELETDTYLFRSVMAAHLTMDLDMRSDKVDFPTVRKLYAQWREVSPNFFGDYYPLTSYSLDERQWMAWQFDRPESGEGVVQAFRRYKSSYVTACFKLRGLDAKARYVVTDMDSEKASEMTGAELLDKGLTISLPEQASAALISYRKLDRSL